jgi:hypothetical protein
MKLTPPTTIAAVVAIATAGFFVGRISSSPAAAVAGDTPEAQGPPSRTSSLNATGGTSATSRSSRAARAEERRTTPAKVRGEEALARLESIVRGDNALDRNRALLAFIDQLEPDEFEGAIAHFRSLGITDSRFSEYGMLLTAWAQTDPVKALDYVKQHTNGGFALNTVISSWAATDPEGAIAWAKSNHTGDGANPYLPGIIRALSTTDTARASELLTSMPRSRERGEGLDALLPQLLKQGPDAARDWINSLTDEALRNGAMSRAAEQLAKTDPQGTANWLLANPGEALNESLDNVVGAWAATDEKAAVAFFSGLPKGEARNDAFRGVISAVASRDPKSAAAMIDRYSGDADDGAIRSFVWHSFGSDPSLAVDYVGRIADAGERERTYRRTLEFWMDRDPANAQAWIQTNPLPEAVQQHFQRRAAETRQ